jgi:hypothetical protein
MVSNERLKQLENIVSIWRDCLANAMKQRDYLLNVKERGISITDGDDRDILPDRIRQEDIAVLEYEKGLTRSQSMLGRAQTGDDV